MEEFIEYIESIEDNEHREKFEQVLKWVLDNFTELDTRFAWKQPMFTDHDTFIIGFSAYKEHFSISPEGQTIEKFSDKIIDSGYSHTKKMFKIKWDQHVDYELLKEIILYNIEDKKDCTKFWRA